MSIQIALARASAALESNSGGASRADLRWQALLDLATYVETEPEALWSFVARWGSSPDENLRGAVATCLLEGLLEHHFDLLFERVSKRSMQDPNFAATVELCWRFGETENPEQLVRLRVLQETARRRLTGA